MKFSRLSAVALVAIFAFSSVGAAEENVFEETDFSRFYVEAGAAMVLPQGGAEMPRRTGAALRGGWYFAEFWAVEGEVSWLEDRVGFSAEALWHWWGYERFDPFFTMGAKGWMDNGQVGPAAGFGAYYHLTENWSLRFDADAAVGVDSGAEMIYSLGAGIHFAF